MRSGGSCRLHARRLLMADWGWEYNPDAHHVIGETPNLAFVAQGPTSRSTAVKACATSWGLMNET